MGRPCYGAKQDASKGYNIDPWVERACPNYAAVNQEIMKPGTPKNAEVIVRVFGPQEMDEACSGDDCIVETLELDGEILQNLFNRIYGGKVAVESIDTASEEVSMFPEVKRLIEGGAKLVVMIDDEVKFVGSIPLPMIKREIERRGINRVSHNTSQIRP
jgi:hypothetical protein